MRPKNLAWFCAGFLVLAQILWAAQISIPDVSGSWGDPVAVPLEIDDAAGLIALQGTLQFGAESLHAESAALTADTGVWRLSWHIEAGRISVAAANHQPLSSGSATLLEFQLRVDVATPCDLVLVDAVFFDDNLDPIDVTIQNGRYIPGSATPGLKGDLDGDEDVDIHDVLRLVDIILDRSPAPSPYESWAGDLNDDGYMDLFDCLMAVDLVLA